MFIYAGIDEAGYGPMFGPLLVGRAVLAIPNLPSDADPPHLWQRLSKAVCRNLSSRKGRIAINDSKQLKTQASGIKHLEVGCLAFAALAGIQPRCVGDWLDGLGESCHQKLDHLPWYAPDDDRPWDPLPAANTDGELAVARGMLVSTANRIGVTAPDLGAAVVFEDRFNQMVANTRSKAATSFTFVARHLSHIWNEFGEHDPFVVVDRQSGRTRYLELLQLNFPGAMISIVEESETRSAYVLEEPGVGGAAGRRMRITFTVEAEQAHMPVALASMISKYTRELLMARFNAYFARHAPGIRPTAGYATDARRFWQEIEPHLPALAIEPTRLCRTC